MDVPLADIALRYWVSRRARRKPVRPLAELNLDRIDRVLLVLTTGLGDAILSTPVFLAVRKRMPHARIGLFIRTAWASLFHDESILDEIILYPGKWRRFFTTLNRLRAFSPQLALVLHGNDPDILPLVYLSGAEFILRIPTAGTRYAYLLSNYGREADSATITDWHYIDNRLRILDSIGVSPARRTPFLRPRKSEAVSDWVAKTCGNRPYVVVHPWAAGNYKSWPITQVREFLNICKTAFPEYLFVVTGTSEHLRAATELTADLPHVRNAVGRFSLGDIAVLLSQAKAAIAPDTGILHMAAALNIPTVGLFAPTRPDLVGQRAATAVASTLVRPLTCSPCREKNCPHRPAMCMAQFSGSDVARALQACLEPRE